MAATYVDYEDAVAFCECLTENDRRDGRLPAGGRYRLPTEAEWEYACRAGSSTRWSFGDDETDLGEHAWFRGNAAEKGEEYAHEVGQKLPNPWGLLDMHGNVWEWCSDWYGEKHGSKFAVADPLGPDAGSLRVLRGGCWGDGPVECRSSSGTRDAPSHRRPSIGFRVVCELE